jgi:serine/threonine protein kinase
VCVPLVLCCVVLPSLGLPCLAWPCLVLSCRVLSCRVLSCFALPCLALPLLALPYSYLICSLSCLVLLCLVLSCFSFLRRSGREKLDAKTDVIFWVAGTDLLWSIALGTMLLWILVERPADRCSPTTWSAVPRNLHLIGTALTGASMGYTCIVGYFLLKILYAIYRDNDSGAFVATMSNPEDSPSLHALGSGQQNGNNTPLAAHSARKLPNVEFVHHCCSWGVAVTFACVIKESTDQIYFLTYAAINFGVFFWTLGVFLFSKVVVAKLETTFGGSPPVVLYNRQLMARFLLAYVVCNLPWTVFCVYINIYGKSNEILFGIADPLLVLQGFANYVCYSASQEKLVGCCCVTRENDDDDLEMSWSGKDDAANSTFLNFFSAVQSGKSVDAFETLMLRLQCVIEPERLVVGKVIGVGSSATVREGSFGNTNVAIKIPRVNHRSALESSVSSGRFETEIAVLVAAAHPCVVQFFGICRCAEGICIITERCDTSLAKYIKSVRSNTSASLVVRRSWKDRSPLMLKWMAEIADGLSCLHSKEIVHGDLKPSNVLLHHNTAKLCDFGCARSMAVGFDASVGLGTIGYMSLEMMQPELNSGSTMSDKVDIFAFGSTCWSMVELKEPFEGEQPSIFWVRDFVQNGGRLPIECLDCPPTLKDMIYTCWEVDASSRPASSRLCKQISELQMEEGVISPKACAAKPLRETASSIASTASSSAVDSSEKTNTLQEVSSTTSVSTPNNKSNTSNSTLSNLFVNPVYEKGAS